MESRFDFYSEEESPALFSLDTGTGQMDTCHQGFKALVKEFKLPDEARFRLDSIAFQLLKNTQWNCLNIRSLVRNYAKAAVNCGKYGVPLLKELDEAYSKVIEYNKDREAQHRIPIRWISPFLPPHLQQSSDYRVYRGYCDRILEKILRGDTEEPSERGFIPKRKCMTNRLLSSDSGETEPSPWQENAVKALESLGEIGDN